MGSQAHRDVTEQGFTTRGAADVRNQAGINDLSVENTAVAETAQPRSPAYTMRSQQIPPPELLRLQRVAGNTAVGRLVGSHSRPSLRIQRLAASEIIAQHSSVLGNLDEEDLAADLARRLPAESSLVVQVLAALDDSDRDDVAFEISRSLSVSELSRTSEELRASLIRPMLGGWVTDEEEGEIARLWESFGEGLAEATSRNRDLWKKSLAESDQLANLPRLRQIRAGFARDVVQLAQAYLKDNEQGIYMEGELLGIPMSKGVPGDRPLVEEPGYVENTQQIARLVLELQRSLDNFRKVQVGYDYEINHYQRSFTRPRLVPAYFNPAGQPPVLGPRGDESPPLATWEETKAQHDRVASTIRGFANLYPSIFVLLQQERLEDLATAGSAIKAGTVLRSAFEHSLSKIHESRQMLASGDIAYYDLVALHGQLFDGSSAVSFKPEFDWSHPFHKSVAMEELATQEARQFWTSLGLSLVGAAAIIAAPFTGGASAALLVGVGLGIGAGQAAVAWERYLDVSTMSDTNVRDELSLLAEGQATEALVTAVIDTAAVFLDAFGARAATTAGRAAARAELAVADRALRDRMAQETRRRLTRGAAGEAALTAAGAAVGVVQHELHDEEPEIEVHGELATLGPPSFSDMASESIDYSYMVSESIDATVAQRASKSTQVGDAFERRVSRGLLRGKFIDQDVPVFDFVLPGQYTGSGWGIDRIGISIDPAGRVHLFHLEMKMQMNPELGRPLKGTQTGKAWTSNAVERLLNDNHELAIKARKKLLKAYKDMYPGYPIDETWLKAHLKRQIPKARVLVFVPKGADVRRLWRQVGGLVRHGRRARVIRVP